MQEVAWSASVLARPAGLLVELTERCVVDGPVGRPSYAEASKAKVGTPGFRRFVALVVGEAGSEAVHR